MNRLYIYVMSWTLLLIGALFPVKSDAQTVSDRDQLGILRIEGRYENIRRTYFNAGVDLSELLRGGNPDEATFEFWINTVGGNEDWWLGDLLENSKSFSVHGNKGYLDIYLGSQFYRVNSWNPGPQWNHIALVFDNGNLVVYLNGVAIAGKDALTIISDTRSERNLYFKKTLHVDLALTEIRAWNQKRPQGVINEQRWLAYPLKSASELLVTHQNSGLQLLLGGSASIDTSFAHLSDLSHLHWPNVLKEKSPGLAVPAGGDLTGTYHNLMIGTIDTNREHPILDNTHLFLYASNGDYEDKVMLEWMVLQEGDEYRVFKDNRLVGRIDKDESKDGFYLTYEDDKVLPGDFYTYRVEAFKDDGTQLSYDEDGGFIHYNGLITGHIKTQSDIFVEGVKVVAVPESGKLIGSALQLLPGKSRIHVQDINDLVDVEESVMIEFWYQKDGAGSSNTLIEMDAISIKMQESQLEAHYNGHSITIPIPDGDWHHYAVLLGKKGAHVYCDGGATSHVSNTSGFVPQWKTGTMDLNTEIRHTAKLDELRIWDMDKRVIDGEVETNEAYWQRVELQIIRNYDLQVSGLESDLLMCFRFDAGTGNLVFDIARNRKERVRGLVAQSSGALHNGTGYIPMVWVSDSKLLPEIFAGAYTDAGGNYAIGAINYGEATTFVVTPSRPDYTFAPDHQDIYLQRSLEKRQYTKEDVDFTDISSLPLAGRVYYQTGPDETFATYQECNSCYPVPKGQQITIDGVVAASVSEDAQTDITGLYSISAPLGKHSIQVSNPPRQQSFGTHSVRFDGDGYLVSQRMGVIDRNSDWVLSGWIKPEPDANVSREQTLFNFAFLEVVLVNNTILQVKDERETGAFLSSTVNLNNASNEFTFFAVVYDKEKGKFGLYVEDTYDEQISDEDFGQLAGAYIHVGVRHNNVTHVKENYFAGNMDQLELRKTNYVLRDASGLPMPHQVLLESIKTGELVKPDGQDELFDLTTGLVWSFPFEHTKGNRAVAYGANSKIFYELNFRGGVSWDEVGTTYTREFRYEYEASNTQWNPEGEAYQLNITQAYTELHFENKTRFGFLGNIIVPCGYSAGEWAGTIKRTDIVDPGFEKTIDDSYFNDDHTLFAVDGLLPGSYRVTLTNVADPTRKIQSPVIDITKGWATYDFEFRNPLEIDYEFYVGSGVDSKLGPICASDSERYEFKAGEQYQIVLSTYELYGEDDDKCYVGEATVKVNGDAAIFAQGDYSTYTGDDPNSEVVEFAGKVTIPFLANTPNFQGDYTRKLDVSVTHDGRNRQAQVIAYNTGARQEESNFTIRSPQVISVLHDPPGGNSYTYLEKGHEIVYTSSFEEGFEQEFSFEGEVGIDWDKYAGGGLGAIFIMKTADVDNGLTIGAIQNAHYKKMGSNVSSVSFDRRIQTSSDPTVVGLDADVYIGMGQVIHLGKGRNLSIPEGACEPVLAEDVTVGKAGVESLFVYTHQDIKDVLIPQLEIAIEAESDSSEKNDLRRQLKIWSDILTRNVERVNSIEDHPSWLSEAEVIYKTERNGRNTIQTPVDTTYNPVKVADLEDEGLLNVEISFSGGVEVSYDFADSDEEISGEDLGGGAGVKEEYEGILTIGTVKIGTKQSFQLVGYRNDSDETADSHSTKMGFTLYDGDNGDHFNVAVKKDPVYLSPIFKTLAGQSMCPYEAGTQPREGVEITADEVVDAYALYGEEAVFPVTLKNTQVAVDATPKLYFIVADRGNVPDGAVIRYNGDPLGNGLAIDYEAGETEKHGVITVTHPDWAQGGQLDYESIPILFYSGCERNGRLYSSYHIDELKEENCGSLPYRSMYINDDGSIDAAKKVEYDQLVAGWQACTNHTKMVDQVLLSAHFRSPCITEIQVKKPGNDWVVNATSGNQLELVFAIPGLTTQSVPGGMTKLHIERYDKDNPTEPLLLKTLLAENLKGLVQTDGNVHYLLDVGGLADGDYKLRLTPQCGNESDTEPWRRQTPTEWLEGHIFRTQPIITSVTPAHGGVMGEDKTVTITYDRPIQYMGVSSANISLRGVLAEKAYVPKSGRFDNNTLVTIPHHEELSVDSVFTIEFWIKVLKYPTGGQTDIIAKRDGSGKNYLVDIYTNGAIGNSHAPTSERVSLNEWRHVAVIYDGNRNIKTLIDGVENVDSTLPSNTHFTTNSSPVIIGSSQLNAQLDEIRIWNIARDPAEVLTDRSTRLLGNEEGLIGYYVMDSIALEGEAIRDFTGLAKGTTADNLTFVSNDAAPIDMESIIQDVPAEVVRAGSREIVIQPKSNLPVWVYEGTEITAFIKDNAIRGEYGNPAQGKTWTFRVNANDVAWAQAGKTVFVPNGASVDIGFTMDLLNKSSNDVQYRLVADPLPGRVTLVGDKETGKNYTLHGTYSGEPVAHTLTFAVNKDLTSEFTDTPIIAEILDMDGAPIAYERFLLDVHISTSGSSSSRMNVWAEVEINGEVSEDVNDQVSALMDETMYDRQSVLLMDGKYLVYLQIPPVNGLADGNVLFNAWDASANTNYFSAEHPFIPGNYGTTDQPVKLIFDRKEKGEVINDIQIENAGYQLSQNQPNPMSDHTSIGYRLPDGGHVSLQVLNVYGGVYRTLVDHYQEAGEYQVEWDGKTDAGQKLAPGLYIYTLLVNGRMFHSKLIIK